MIVFGSPQVAALRPYRLADPSLLQGFDEFPDGITLQILSVFPTFILQQIQNAIAVQQIVSRGVGSTDLNWTILGYRCIHRQPAIDRAGAYGSLLCLYLAGVVFVALIGVTLDRPEWILLATAFFAGFCVSGGQKSVIALSALFYPAPIRSTGIGWALGVGRLGGIAGPLLMGMLIQQHIASTNLFFASSIPMLLAAISVAAMRLIYRRREAAGATVPTGA